jgi:hypothetical protein
MTKCRQPNPAVVVRGVEGSTSVEEASTVVHWAEQMRGRLTLRLIAAGRHPIHTLFTQAFDTFEE